MQLPWLSPCAASLLALTRLPAAAAWQRLRHDPGAVLLIARQSAQALVTPAISFFPSVLHDPAILEGAIGFLSPRSTALHHRLALNEQEARTSDGAVNWYDPRVRPIYHNCLLYARLAERV